MLELICKLDIGYKDNEKYVIASSTDEEVQFSRLCRWHNILLTPHKAVRLQCGVRTYATT